MDGIKWGGAEEKVEWTEGEEDGFGEEETATEGEVKVDGIVREGTGEGGTIEG